MTANPATADDVRHQFVFDFGDGTEPGRFEVVVGSGAVDDQDSGDDDNDDDDDSEDGNGDVVNGGVVANGDARSGAAVDNSSGDEPGNHGGSVATGGVGGNADDATGQPKLVPTAALTPLSPVDAEVLDLSYRLLHSCVIGDAELASTVLSSGRVGDVATAFRVVAAVQTQERCPVFIAALHNHAGVVRALLASAVVRDGGFSPLHFPGSNGRSALYVACSAGALGIAQELLWFHDGKGGHGADVTSRSDAADDVPDVDAAPPGSSVSLVGPAAAHVKAVPLAGLGSTAVRRGGGRVIDGVCDDGSFPLWIAAAAGHSAVVQLLVDSGADTTAVVQSSPPPTQCTS